MGNKILRQRLKGPTLAKYYPPRGPTVVTLEKTFKRLQLETINEEEDDRLEHLAGQAILSLLLFGCKNLTRKQGKVAWKGCTEEEEGSFRSYSPLPCRIGNVTNV